MRSAGVEIGRLRLSRLRETASRNSCWIAGVGEPSPISQQMEVTKTGKGTLSFPSLFAVIFAEPPPTALMVALTPEDWMVTTRLFEVLQTIARSVKEFPLASRTVACRVALSPRFSVNLETPELIRTSRTASFNTGGEPGSYSIAPPSKV